MRSEYLQNKLSFPDGSPGFYYLPDFDGHLSPLVVELSPLVALWVFIIPASLGVYWLHLVRVYPGLHPLQKLHQFAHKHLILTALFVLYYSQDLESLVHQLFHCIHSNILLFGVHNCSHLLHEQFRVVADVFVSERLPVRLAAFVLIRCRETETLALDRLFRASLVLRYFDRMLVYHRMCCGGRFVVRRGQEFVVSRGKLVEVGPEIVHVMDYN